MIAPVVGMALELFLNLSRIAIERKEMDKQGYAEVKKRFNKVFSSIPEWDELGG